MIHSLLPFQNLDLLSVGIAVASTVVLGFAVLFNDFKSITNKTFLGFALVTTLWGVVNYLNYQAQERLLVLWLIRSVMFFAVWQSFFLFQFMYVFPKEKIKFPKWYQFYLIPLVIFTAVLTLTPLVFYDVELAPVGEVSRPRPGPGVTIFGIISVGLVLISILLLILKFMKSSGVERIKIRYVLIGTILMFFLIISFNFFASVLFNTVRFIPLGALFTFPFIAFTSYAILRHRLFNIKVAGTAVLVFLLSVVTFSEVILARELSLILYRASVFILVLLFGVLLIKQVLREVELREELARAYEVEKRANEELEKLDKIKNQFLLITQHNLRKPLTSMRGFLDILINGVLGKQNKKTIEGAKNLQAAVEDSIEEVGDFLNIAQFQMGKSAVDLKPNVELLPILDRIFAKLKIQADAKGIYLKFDKPDKPIVINADSVKLKAALSNIIDNAIKYTMKGGVTISIKYQVSSIKIEVRDTGIGVPKDKIESIFETQFERTEQAKRTAEIGKGIGLYLSAQIIKSHNGKIWAESEGEDKGSTFYIELPLGS